MNIKTKRDAGMVLGRAGLAAEIIKICKAVAESGNYKEAMKAAGKIKVLAEASTYDSYWSGKVNTGITDKEFDFKYMLKTIESKGSKMVWM